MSLPANVTVNRSTPGSFGGGNNQQSTIAANTAVRSYYVNIDRASSGSLEGSITFDSQILGLIYRRTELAASAAMFEFPGTSYPGDIIGPPFENSDDLTLSTNTVTWDAFMGGVWSDVMRVIVAC